MIAAQRGFAQLSDVRAAARPARETQPRHGPPSPSTVFRNARVVLQDAVVTGTVAVAQGRIVSVDTGNSSVRSAVDWEGDYLLPGLVELHTDNFERHLMPRPKVRWAELPALLAHDAEIAAAGITTVFDALGVGEADPESLRGSDWRRVLESIDIGTAQDLLRADHLLHVRCELPAPNTLELFEPFRGHPRLSLVSLMDHTPGQRQWEDIGQARTYYVGKKGWTLDKFDRQVELSAQLQAQYAAPNRRFFVDHCRSQGITMASHDDTTPAHVEQAHGEGVVLSEFPTTIAAAKAARQCGLLTIMGAPNVVRGGSHSGNVSADVLAREGLMDILSSDYVPGSLLTAMLRLVRDGIYTLPEAVRTVTRSPAAAAGLHDRGSIEAGLRADLVRVQRTELPAGGEQAVVREVWRQGRRVL